MSRPANTLFLHLLSFLSFLLTSSTFVTNGYALDKTPTGFFYPTGVTHSIPNAGPGWGGMPRMAGVTSPANTISVSTSWRGLQTPFTP